MSERIRNTQNRRWAAPILLATVMTLLIVSTAGAADRVVLGEYFTNVY
jgi:hypothetical protein